MEQPKRPHFNHLDPHLHLWNTAREMYMKRGFDIAARYAEWARKFHQSLPSPGVREDFDSLCTAGCPLQGLASLLFFLQNSAVLEAFWAEVAGQANERTKAIASLEKAAETLERLYPDAIYREETGEADILGETGRIPISQLVTELRLHAQVANIAQLLKRDTEARSAREVARYLLTAYVRRMTGRFHDQSVSGLVGEVLKGSDDYNDVAQRMWRSRNYERLNSHYSKVAKFLTGMSVVIEHTA
jgi:hypothetical protein